MKMSFAFAALLSAGFALADGKPVSDLAAKELPVFPMDCLDQIQANGMFCSSTETLGTKVHVTFVGVASKDLFPEASELIARYTDFERWPEYVDRSPQAIVSYRLDGAKALPVIESEDGRLIYPQYFDYDLKVQGIPLLKQTVKGVTYNWEVPAYAGALKSIEFEAQAGPVPGYDGKLKGMKSQVGSVHAMDCVGLDICDGNSWLVVFDTTVEPEVSFALAIAGKTMKAGIEDILAGILE